MLNFTDVTEFILLGLTSHRERQVLLFVIFLLVYTITMVGNIGMILLIKVSPQLSSPMYFFLSHLSFVDVWFSSNVTPKMLENLLSETKTISYAGCLVQCFFFIALVPVEVFILPVMAFDRYMAIGNPLLYGSKMSRVVCIRLISFPYVYGFLISLVSTLWTYGLYFCGKIEINHFYCADPPLIKMACAGTFVKEYMMIILASINFIYSLTVVIISYLFILIAILRMNSAEGRHKAFSTCGSHLTAVVMFYGTLIFMYLRRPTEESVEQGKVVAVFYTTVIPMLNPMIYSLRNKDVKEAMNIVIGRILTSQNKVTVASDLEIFLAHNFHESGYFSRTYSNFATF
ncbi:olfactory receptor 5M3-like [Bos javanicus]|uniref:olfactory receptor 5M3-like n=1 Tax=Bos javanicus TaxID=9906 RepID=UPI002AA7E23F|nr:olfactory receptor 5M3-like [Bos javanicus]